MHRQPVRLAILRLVKVEEFEEAEKIIAVLVEHDARNLPEVEPDAPILVWPVRLRVRGVVRVPHARELLVFDHLREMFVERSDFRIDPSAFEFFLIDFL